MDNAVTTPGKKGLVIGLILAILGFTLFYLKIDRNSPLQYINYLIFISGIIWSVWYYGKQINYQSTYGNYFAHGFKTSAVVTIVIILCLVVLILFFPEFKENTLAALQKTMQKGGIPEEVLKPTDPAVDHFGVLLIGQTMIVYLFFGAAAALIGAGITRKDPTKISMDFTQIK